MTITYYFVENLSLASLLKAYFEIKYKRVDDCKKCLYYINSTRFVDIINVLLKQFYPLTFIKFNFEFENILDRENTVFGFKKLHTDTALIIDDICNMEFPNSKQTIAQVNFRNYFRKILVSRWPCSGKEFSSNKILLMLCAVADYAHNNSNKYKIIFFLDKRPWGKELQNYAYKFGIDIVEVKFILRLTKSNIKKYFLTRKYLLWIVCNILNITNWFFSAVHNYKFKKIQPNLSSFDHEHHDPMIIVDQVMQYFSSSTFWKSSHLPHQNIIFASNYYKVNQTELDEIRDNGMEFIALSKSVAKGLDALYFSPKYEIKLSNYNSRNNKSSGSKIVQQWENKFLMEKSYWSNLFKQYNAKIYVTHLKWNTSPIVATEAINELGGVSAIWQTSFYETMGLNGIVNSDIYFSFSSNSSKIEKLNGSSIKYIVGVGYIYDFNFIPAKIKAREINHYLKSSKASKIISIFDGSSSEDARWSVGNAALMKDYQFLLEKVVEEKWLGLVIKSKRPGSLRKRLGDVSEILDTALKTGRCYFSEDIDYGDKNLSIRPAVAAFASDIAIHLCMYAGSAGLEAALTGTPTLMLDRYNLKDSQFYN